MNLYPPGVAPSTAVLCVAPGCAINPTKLQHGEPSRPRDVVPGTDLCQWHHARFRRLLGDLTTLWSPLENALYRRPAGPKNTRVATSGHSDLAQSWNPAATEVLADIRDWAKLLLRLTIWKHTLDPEAATSAAQLTDPTPLILASLQIHDARWLSSWPTQGPHLLERAEELRTEADRALTAPTVRRLRIRAAICGHHVDDFAGMPLTCPEPMVALLGDDDRPTRFVCSAHPNTHRQYTRDEFSQWATPDQQAQEWISIDVAALLLGVGKSKAYEYARTWTTEPGRYPHRYLLTDVTSTAQQRKQRKKAAQ